MADAPNIKAVASAAAKEAAKGVARGATDAAELLRERLSKAPNLKQVVLLKKLIGSANEAIQNADVELAQAVSTGNRAMAEARRHQADIEGWLEEHRVNAPAVELMKKTFHALPAHLAASFSEDRHVRLRLEHAAKWQDWTPPVQPVGLTQKGKRGFLLRWGTHQPGGADPLLFSALPLVGGGRPWVIVSDDPSDKNARDLLCALALRLALSFPQQARFTFLDPLYYGQTFPLQRFLPAVRETGADMAQDLQRIQADVRRIIRDVVAFHPSFEALPIEQQTAERYEFIFAADFPKAKAYDRRVAEMLFDIGRAGPKAGRYLILHLNVDADLPHGIDVDQLGEAYTIDLSKGGRLVSDHPPSPEVQQALLEKIRAMAPARRSVGVVDVLPPRPQWWAGSAARRVEVSLDGQKDGLQLAFGLREDGIELVHAVLAASAGAGKSNMLHALILGLATRYPPEELQLYLMDLKQGVEFQSYAKLPHAAVVAYNTAPALARAVLAELRREMTRRYEHLFRPAGVQKLEDYRHAGQPHGAAPRVLLVIDEYQALFQGGDVQEVSGDLLALSTQGRAAGIHMLLGSQTFRAIGMQGSEQIFNNINIRVAMRMPAAAIQALTEFDREGKEMIRELDGTGQVVINTGLGRDGANKRGQVVLVPPDSRSEVLAALAEIATGWAAPKRALWPQTQVFDGSRPPSIAAHPLTQAARVAGTALGRDALAGWAARPKSAGGLASTDWRVADAPLPLALGREFAVYGDATCVLKRLPNQNLLILGASAGARLGMLRGIVASLAAVAPDVIGRARAIDFSGDPQVGAALAVSNSRISVINASGGAAEVVTALELPTNNRIDLLILIEPDRSPALLRPSDPLARSPGPEALERRLRDGPLAGGYTIVVLNGVPGLTRVLGRRGANNFAWRAATQMSQEDSQDLLGNRQAAQLRNEGQSGPEAALLADVDGNRYTRFMPYGE